MASEAVQTAIYRMGLDDQQYVAASKRVTEANRKITASGEQVVVSEEKVTRATRQSAEGIDRKIARLDPLAAAEARYARALAQHERLELEGVGTAQQRLRLLELERARYDQSTAAVERNATARSRANGLAAGARSGLGALGLGGGLVGGALGGTFAIGIIAREAREAVSELDALGDAAERAGISGARLQVLRYALEQGAGSAEDADAAMEKFTKSVGQLELTGTGPAKAALDRLGISIRDAGGAFKDQEQIFDEVAKRFPTIKNEAEQAAISAALFGKAAGGAMAVELRKGTAGIDDAREHLEALNALMGKDLLEAADRLDKRFNDVSLAVEANFNRMTVAALNFFLAVKEGEGGGLVAEDTPGLNRRPPGTPRQKDELFVPKPGDLIAGPRENDPNRRKAMDDLRRALSHNRFDEPEFDYESIRNVAKVAKGHEEAARAVGYHRDAVKELNDDLDFQISNFGKSAEQIRIDTELRRLNVDATSEQGRAITEKMNLIDQESNRLDKLHERMEFEKEITRGIINDLRSGLREGEDLWTAFGNAALNALDSITDKLLDEVLDALFQVNKAGAGGGLGGFLGSLFGGGFGGGAAAAPGQGGIGAQSIGNVVPFRSSAGSPSVTVNHHNEGTPQEIVSATPSRNAAGGIDLKIITRDLKKQMAQEFGLRPVSNKMGLAG